MKLTNKEFILAIIFGILGFVLTMREYILFLNSLTPLYGLLLFYGVVFISIFLLEKVGLVIGGLRVGSIKQTFGSVLIIFAFFVIFADSSAYINYIINNSIDNVSVIYFQTEDGAVWWLWSHITDNITINRLLTYCFTPFVLSLIGGLLITRKPRLQ